MNIVPFKQRSSAEIYQDKEQPFQCFIEGDRFQLDLYMTYLFHRCHSSRYRYSRVNRKGRM
ncbi:MULTISPECIES: hypothetical protein [Priestia]|jgi:hypothetical protein|uniref:Uncharacterized protein n=3 Tax=Priestia TaxID=2800373 RepID=A0AAX6BGV4_PRIMG|nr:MULTISPECIES: hypothetical protein [Priestia]MCL9633936.1 hypothetical protein [Bacillus zanthoxyli]UPK48717.1 hypothetical protein MT476_18825 [Bacillus sp. H8-1]AKP76478.1 hypothetical protein AS52_01513 [Priestia megaterium Q3]AWD66373.1 hypothetical protein C2I28_15490 [Priestia megaterium]MBY0073993.1 hypothetical protein [Priestia aryabhattai]